ncbi:hypothetical protein [Azohydromonas sediminis]|uniref:hypothetical protein n=1 Tax=Azohydromonas sediminis TaxID=2259674 RepID=UPI0013C31212|nr:hypothetical protein [Azohydromonas sediminis]
MPSVPLTRHDIVALAEPFARGGRRVDLAACERRERGLVFKAPATAGDAGAPNETLRLEVLERGVYGLTRRLECRDGAPATRQAQNHAVATRLGDVESVLLAWHFVDGPGYTIACSHVVDRADAPDVRARPRRRARADARRAGSAPRRREAEPERRVALDAVERVAPDIADDAGRRRREQARQRAGREADQHDALDRLAERAVGTQPSDECGEALRVAAEVERGGPLRRQREHAGVGLRARGRTASCGCV